ncbi:ParB N-terminal domain-containing protein [Tateyamaria sp. ANG-S1]|uniref:ParB/RepB/Spo0J family partition protein n=1 Tax=Tateyamaria sp. ANG-S1 TaxID=1577905 RepID=UPI00057DBD5C|nr:ParB N-terminal domain-containing protein [Tateyamaria sp. ANG-S1]KIC47774.1 hypothetical protein RA29_19000 [Tateyamaria sp. ANG-S1]
MAKRKRLTPANPTYLSDGGGPLNTGMRAPIADVASDAAATAALRDVSAAMAEAREAGRMVAELPLDQIDMTYLVRDRVSGDDAEMEALVTSIRDRGQQTPIEVVDLGSDTRPKRYGLISGWRRCQALMQLARDGSGPDNVLALLRAPKAASDAYVAMVEENEIRVGLSYFERARIVIKSVELGVFTTRKKALQGLFGTASRAKRSKIGSFVDIVEAFDTVLAHPHRISERQGLMMAKRLEADPSFTQSVIRLLSIQPDRSVETEQALLSDMLEKGPKAVGSGPEPGKVGSKKAKTPSMSTTFHLRPGLQAAQDPSTGSLHLWGKDLTPDLRDRLLDWLRDQD